MARKHGVIYQGKYTKVQANGSVHKGSIMCKSMLLFLKICESFVIQTSYHHGNLVVHTQNHMVSEG